MSKKLLVWVAVCLGSAILTVGTLRALNDALDLRDKLGLSQPAATTP